MLCIWYNYLLCPKKKSVLQNTVCTQSVKARSVSDDNILRVLRSIGIFSVSRKCLGSLMERLNGGQVVMAVSKQRNSIVSCTKQLACCQQIQRDYTFLITFTTQLLSNLKYTTQFFIFLHNLLT